MTATTEANDSIEARLIETAKELKSLGDCEGVPTDTSTLTDAEAERFQQLKEKLIYHKRMKAANDHITAETRKIKADAR